MISKLLSLDFPLLAHVTDPQQLRGLPLQKLLVGGSRLARMALDFLTCPGMFHSLLFYCNVLMIFCLATSVYTERSFSWGSLTVTKKRNSLSDDSTRAATILSSWSCIPDLIPADDLIQAFNDKSNRCGLHSDTYNSEAEDALSVIDSVTGALGTDTDGVTEVGDYYEDDLIAPSPIQLYNL